MRNAGQRSTAAKPRAGASGAVGLLLLLAAPAAAVLLAPAAPALADEAAVERARSLVETLRRSEDERARRDLYALGAPSLAPLADALAAEGDPSAWERLEETFESVLRARLQDLDAELQREERARQEQAAKEQAAKEQAAPAAVTAAAEALEREILGAGYAAARELAREGAARDDLGALTRRELFLDLKTRLSAEAAAAAAAGSPDALTARLSGLGPLAAPLLAAAIEEGPAEARSVAGAATALSTARYAALLASDDERARRFADESLFGMGPLAEPVLEELAKDGTPDARHRARRLSQRIKWSISEELYSRTGRLLYGFEALPWEERRMMAFELEKQGGAEAVPALRRVLERDPSAGVKVAAAEALARQGDRRGFRFLMTLGLSPLMQSPEIIAAIALDQGVRYLQIRRYDKAIEEFNHALEVQPDNEIALYNLACAYALRYARDKAPADKEAAFDFLERSVEHGFENADHVEKDADLTSLHDDPRWAALIERLKKKRAQGEKP